MKIVVTQKTPAGNRWNEVNTDDIERVSSDDEGNLTLLFTDGNHIEIVENRDWWEANTK